METHTAGRNESTSVAIVGSGGSGVITAGQMLLQAAGRAGRYGLMTRAVGPQIRGGEAAALVRIAAAPVACLDDRCDCLIAVDWKNAERFAAEIPLPAGSLIVADPESGPVPAAIGGGGARVVEVPITALARGIDQGRPNMVALGIAIAVAGVPRDVAAGVVREALRDKGPAAIDAGLAGLAAGRLAATDAGIAAPERAPPAAGADRWLITGNEAAGLGALRGGVRFVAAYPITPATEILEWLAPNLARTGGTLVQAEDELASLNMAIGAAWSGVPALTATSGPGLSLMTESLGLAVAAEVPVVVVDVMRGGPSTGIPTKSEQSDLNLAVYGLHGDAPHLVLAPTSTADCLFTTQWAVHLAERLQSPALVLSDQFLGQASVVIDPPAMADLRAERLVEHAPAADWRRYAVTASGVSPAVLPGTPGGQYTADGLAHDPRGTPSSKAADQAAQLDKRARKLESFDYGAAWADVEGDGDTVILTWGSLAGAAREAAARLRAAGERVRVVALRLLLPARPEALAQALAGARRVLVLEQTHSGQFRRYLRAHYDIDAPVRAFHRAGPLAIRPDEIVRALGEWRPS